MVGGRWWRRRLTGDIDVSVSSVAGGTRFANSREARLHRRDVSLSSVVGGSRFNRIRNGRVPAWSHRGGISSPSFQRHAYGKDDDDDDQEGDEYNQTKTEGGRGNKQMKKNISWLQH